MQLVIETKQNHPIAIALREQHGSVYFLSAEELNAIVSYVNQLQQAPEWIHISPGAVWDFPAMQKGEARAFWIQSPNDNISQPEGIVYVGGYTGIQVGHQGLVVCLDTNDGGSYGEVGHKFLVMGGRHSPGVVRRPNLGEFPVPGKVGVFYIATTTGLVYLWMEGYGDPPTDQYVAISSEIPGRLINSTTFHDLDDLPVVPQVGEIYRDVDTEIYYTWDGVKFSELGGGSGGSGTPNFAYLNDQQYVKYSEATGRLESGKISETPAGIDVNGNIKAQAVELENETGTPANNTITRNGNQLKHTDETGATRNIATDVQVYKTISGNVTLDDSYHNAICWITANAIITVPSTLRADFNCVFDAIGSVAGTFTEGAGVTFSAPNGKILRDDAMCTLAKSSGDYRLNGGLLNE